MGRWTEDMAAVPDGMERIGYDSDTHRYIFRDRANGDVYEGDEYGGMLHLKSRPDRGGPDEPIRLFPTMPAVPVSSATKLPASQTSFQDMLPPHLIAAAPPVAPPRRALSKHLSSPPPSHVRAESGSKRSLWGVVRGGSTLQVKMRDVVETAIRRPSVGKRDESSSGARERPYVRLANDTGSRDEAARLLRDASAHTRMPSKAQTGHLKLRTE